MVLQGLFQVLLSSPREPYYSKEGKEEFPFSTFFWTRMFSVAQPCRSFRQFQALSHPRPSTCALHLGVLFPPPHSYLLLIPGGEGGHSSLTGPCPSLTLTRSGPSGCPFHRPCHQVDKQWHLWGHTRPGSKSHRCLLCVSGQVPLPL